MDPSEMELVVSQNIIIAVFEGQNKEWSHALRAYGVYVSWFTKFKFSKISQ